MFFQAWRYKRFHSAYLLGWLALGIIAGLCAAQSLGVNFSAIGLMAVLVLLLGGFRSARWWAAVTLVIAGFLLGMMRGTEVLRGYEVFDELVGTKQIITGIVADDVETISGSRQRFGLKQIMIDQSPLPGQLFVTVHSTVDLKRGDHVVLEGAMRSGFGSYAAVLSGARLVDRIPSTDLVGRFRERFGEALRAVVVEPLASLGLGFVIGQRSALPETLDEQLRTVGLTHIVVASGYNLTILVRFVMRLVSRHSRYSALVLSLTAVMVFVLLSGFSPSMNRAMIVTVLGLLAWYVGRRFHPMLLIGFVAAATALWNPMYVWSDLGWYLSFFAFAGILIVAPLLMAALYRRRSPSPLEQLVGETISAELMVLPLIAFAFGDLPVLGLLANVLVAPLIPLAMALTAVTGALAMVSISLGQLAALPTMIVIGYAVAVVEMLAGWEFALLPLSVPVPLLIGWYGALIALCVALAVRLRYDFHGRDRRLEA